MVNEGTEGQTMADHHREPTRPIARKEHRCIYCYGPIMVGEQYVQQTGHYDGRAYRNKFHHECWDDCADEARFSGGEFTPGWAPWPERVREAFEARSKTPNVEAQGPAPLDATS